MSTHFTVASLKPNNGASGQPIYISIRGKVYDCSAAADFYGPGGSYAVFAGKDVSRCLAKMLISDVEANAGWSNLAADHVQTLEEWIAKYESKYPIVGSLTLDEGAEEKGLSFDP